MGWSEVDSIAVGNGSEVLGMQILLSAYGGYGTWIDV